MKKLSLIIGAIIAFHCAFAQPFTSNFLPQQEEISNSIQSSTRAPWTTQFAYPIPGDGTLALATDGEYIYIGRHSSAQWTKLNLDGTTVENFTVQGISKLSALTYDGRYFYAAEVQSTYIKKIDMQATPPAAVETINLPSGVIALHCTYDPTADGGNGGFWVGNWAAGQNFFALVKRNGEEIRRIEQSTHGLSGIIGTAFDNVSEGGPYLWTITSSNTAPVIRQLNLNTGLPTSKTVNLATIGLATNDDSGGGMFLAQNIVGNTQTLAALIQNNIIYGWDLMATKDYNIDIAPVKVDLPYYVVPNGAGTQVSGRVKNFGLTTITSYQLTYQIDNGTPATTHITGVNIAPNSEVAFTHPLRFEADYGGRTIKIWTSMPNGVADEWPANDTLTYHFIVYDPSNTVPRYTLLEGFTSSTCPPCVQGNVNLKNVLTQNDAQGGKYTLIKYQMSWPGNGDPYYTLEGATRRGLYGVGSVPWLHYDGVNNMNTSSFNNSRLLAAQAEPCVIGVTGNFWVEGQTVKGAVNVTSTIDISENFKLFVAIVEKRTVNNYSTNGEKEFNQVMKKFIPDADGIILSGLIANEAITKELTWEFKGNYRKPANANSPINHNTEHSVENFANLEVVAWVQNTATKRMLNSGTLDNEIASLPVDFSIIGGNGELSAKLVSSGAPLTSGNHVLSGTAIQFMALPDIDYKVKEWKVNGETVPDLTDEVFRMTFLGGPVTVEFEHIIGITVNNLINVELSPNPFTNEFTITNAEHVQKITLTNTLGQVVKEEMLTGHPTAVISTQSLPQGLYFVTLKNNEGLEITKKIIKK